MTDLRKLRARCVLALAAVVLLAGAIDARAVTRTWKTTSGTGDWSVNTNWSGDTIPQTGEDVVINNAGISVLLTNSAPDSGSLVSLVISNTATLIFSNWNTTLSAATVTIKTNATITCAGPFANAPAMSNRVYVVCSTLTVETGGKIDVDSKGYRGGYGPGCDATKYAYGGTYGGVGGGSLQINQYLTSTNPPYGSTNAPLDPGSGGGDATLSPSGGGAVRIRASGQITVDGTISACAVLGGNGHGGGSGGTVYIECGALAGSGQILAKGGAARNEGGGGGGGRIAVVYTNVAAQQSLSPTLFFSAEPGVGGSMGGFNGEVGTLYFPDTTFFPTPALTGGYYLNIPGFAAWSPASLTISNGTVRFQDGFQLAVSNSVLIGTNGGLDLRNHATLSCGGSLTLTNGGALYVRAGATNAGTAYGAFVSVTGALRVATNSSVYPYSDGTTGGSVFFQLGQLTVAAGGKINADYKGYAYGYGPGIGSFYYSGGTYGGVGGRSTKSTYGSSNAPIDPGSGSQRGYLGSGGSAWVQVSGLATIDGAISANGTSGGGGYGVGSGGGIYLWCRRLIGNGQFLANGGGAGNEGGGGGGGRIAVWRVSDGSPMGISAVATGGAGGTLGGAPGSNGTVVWGWIPTSGTVIFLR